MKLAVEGGTPVRSRPWPSWPVVDESDVQAVADVVRGGVWGSTSGEQVRAFESEFAAYSGVAHAVALNSGTTALQVALEAMGVGPGDEVIVPSYTFVATAAAVSLVGAQPVFADIEPDTYNIDPRGEGGGVSWTVEFRPLLVRLQGRLGTPWPDYAPSP